MLRAVITVVLLTTTYQINVKPLLNNHCVECHHHNGREPDLSSFPFQMSGVSDQNVIVDKILGITAPSGRMPPAPRTKLAEAERNIIQQWKNEGLQP